MNTSTNLLFRSYGGLSKDNTSKLLRGTGGLTKGSSDILGIKSSRVQKIWERTQEFDDSRLSQERFSQNVDESQNSFPNYTPERAPKTSQEARQNLDNSFQNLMGQLTPIEHIVEENPKTPVRKLSEPRVSSPLLARRRSSWLAIEQQKNLMGLSETPPTPKIVRRPTPPSLDKEPQVIPQSKRSGWSIINNRSDLKDDFVLAFRRTKRFD